MTGRFFLCICFLICSSATVASDFVITDLPRWCFPAARKPSITVDSLGPLNDIPSRWVKKNPIAEQEFSDPIKAEKDRDLLEPGFFGGYHRAVLSNQEYWVIAVSEIEVISITTKVFAKIHFKILNMGSWQEITAGEGEYKNLLCECMNLDIQN